MTLYPMPHAPSPMLSYSVSPVSPISAFADLNSFARFPAARELKYGVMRDRITRIIKMIQIGRVNDIKKRFVSLAAATAKARARFASTMGPNMIPRQMGAKGISNFRIP